MFNSNNNNNNNNKNNNNNNNNNNDNNNNTSIIIELVLGFRVPKRTFALLPVTTFELMLGFRVWGFEADLGTAPSDLIHGPLVRGEPEGPFRVIGPFEAAAAPRVQRVLVKIEHAGADIVAGQ
jgi:hypothetical protein